MIIGAIAFIPSPLEKIEETVYAEEQRTSQTKKLSVKPETKKIETKKIEANKFDPKDSSTWPKCKTDEIVRADNGKCAKKPITKKSSSNPSLVATQSVGGSGSCESEILKYDWNHSVALAVARAESGLRPEALNNNPATRDYSVGCFQINLYGANARTRPSEATLKNAAANVRFAYGIYVDNGRSFIGQWGVCRMITCY